MSTLQSKKNPASRKDVGDLVIANGKTTDVAPVKKRFAAFAKTHAAFVAADGKVEAATKAVHATEAKVGELDVAQDEAVDALASALAGEGGSRTRPFAPFKLGTPSDIRDMGDVEEAKTIHTLATRVRKKKPGKAVLAACAAAEKAASAVQAAAAPIATQKKARHAAIVARDAIGIPWEKAFGALKRGARAAEDEGAAGLFDALFGAAAPRASKKRGKTSKAKGGATPASPSGGDGAAGATKGA
jgi:hypothetical protein